MIYQLLLGLLLLIQPYSFQTRDKITDKTNIAKDDPSLALHDTVRDISVETNTFTAGNTKCKQGSTCGNHGGKSYSWCYTDDTWNYCCTGSCGPVNNNTFMKCYSGSGTVLCTPRSMRTVSGKSCLPSHTCGYHEDKLDKFTEYWCYVDEAKNWDYCCHPLYNCKDIGDGYGHWCYTGTEISKNANWQYCKP